MAERFYDSNQHGDLVPEHVVDGGISTQDLEFLLKLSKGKMKRKEYVNEHANLGALARDIVEMDLYTRKR